MKEGKKSGGVEKRGKSKGRESEGRAKEMDVLRKTWQGKGDEESEKEKKRERTEK